MVSGQWSVVSKDNRSYGKDDTAVLYFSRRDAETQRKSFSVILCAPASLREIVLPSFADPNGS
ncbi:MAG: hypothetical protein AB1611_06780 [bacterium]